MAPTEIINLPQLKYLNLFNCDLQGNLAFMKSFTKVQELWIDKSPGVNGAAPSEIGHLSNTLGVLFLHGHDVLFQKSHSVYAHLLALHSSSPPLDIAAALSATDCSLSGNLPAEMGLLTNA